MNADLEYIADSIFIEALYKDSHFIVLAQDIIGNVASGIKEYVSDIYDSNRPLSSIMAFIGPGLLWKLNFPIISVLYTVAEAFGFDWKSFWSNVGRGIVRFVNTLRGAAASPEEASTQINDVVSSAFNQGFTGEIDEGKLANIAMTNKLGADISNAKELIAFGKRYSKDSSIIKQAQASLFRGKLAKFFIRTISWLVKTALISLGFVSGAGAVSGLLGTHPGNDEDDSSLSSLVVSPNASPDLFSVHPNDLSRVWIERGDINSIDGLLKSWIVGIYPQLQDKMDEITNSSGYRSMRNKFVERNKMASGLGMLSIPRPYERKADVVAEILSSYLRDHPMQDSNKPVYK